MRWRIMVVDDEADIRAILKATLSEKYEVVEAVDGLDALEKLERYEPDFVCMDVMMPMMDGFESCAAIRKHPRFARVPVMFLSAMTKTDDIKRGYGAGANLYLTKPFDPARLLLNIDMHFEELSEAPRKRRHTLADILKMEREGIAPPSPGSPEVAPPPAARTAADERRQPASAAERKIPRVLIVDDEPDMHSIVRVSLEGIAEVVQASDGIQAIERLVRYQPDIMMIDIMLPKVSGFQLCQSIRSNKAFAKLPILVCSAKCGDRDRQFATRVGANSFLAKPFTAPELQGKIAEMTKLPGFAVRAKALSYEEILAAESPEPEPEDDATDSFSIEREQSRANARELEKLIEEEKGKDADSQGGVDADDTTKVSGSGKRSIMRFGKK